MTAFLTLAGLFLTAAVVAGMVLGEWLAYREAQANAHRRQVLAGLAAVSAARGRHPGGRDQFTLQWLALGDAWQVEPSLIRGLTVADVKQMLAASRQLRAMFGGRA